MLVYLLRRLLYTIPIVFGVALIVFTLFHLVGGDPVYTMLGKYATVEKVAELRHELGFDQPKYMQFLHYCKQIVTFDYGRSYRSREEISTMIWNGIGPSLSLTVPAFLINILIAISIALLVSYYRGRWIDKVGIVLCVAGMSISSLAFILFGQYYFAFKLGWFPISGYEPHFPDFLQFIALPVIIYVMIGIGVDVRFFRTAILDETSQDYVRTARAKGVSDRVVFFKHVLKNSMIPIITFTVIEIPFLILGTLLLENYFGIPGLGSITVEAVHNSDFAVLKAMTTIYSLLNIIGNIATDMLYSVVDPRVSLK
ncbi:MAG: ABC transporter permease [Bacteriovoracia bacterium]